MHTPATWFHSTCLSLHGFFLCVWDTLGLIGFAVCVAAAVVYFAGVLS